MRYIDDLADLGDDLVGSLELADVGARFGRRRRSPRGRSINPRRLVPRVPGAPGIIVGLQPLPLGTVVFTPTSGTLLQLVARPQRPFKGQRLVIARGNLGAGAPGLIVNVLRLEIGTNNQFVFGGAGVPIDAFQAGAFDTNMMLQPATPGVDITLQLQISAAPGAGESVTVSGAMWGTVIAS